MPARSAGYRLPSPATDRSEPASRSVRTIVPQTHPRMQQKTLKFRRSRAVPEAKSYRVTRDRAGRWHVAFAVIPELIPGTGTGEVVGIDRGVAVTLALSDGTTYQAPADRSVERVQQRLSCAKRGSNRRTKLRARLAKLHAHNADARKDWAEKSSTEIAPRYDLIRIENLKVRNMTRSARGTIEQPGRNIRQKAGLNRAVRQQGWSLFALRLERKAAGRVEKVNPAFTSQRCSACGHVAADSRKSQALFACVACSYTDNADVNAAKNIAAGHAVTARGGLALAGPVNCEPSPDPSGNPAPLGAGGCQLWVGGVHPPDPFFCLAEPIRLALPKPGER
jgi:putative transposase